MEDLARVRFNRVYRFTAVFGYLDSQQGKLRSQFCRMLFCHSDLDMIRCRARLASNENGRIREPRKAKSLGLAAREITNCDGNVWF